VEEEKKGAGAMFMWGLWWWWWWWRRETLIWPRAVDVVLQKSPVFLYGCRGSCELTVQSGYIYIYIYVRVYAYVSSPRAKYGRRWGVKISVCADLQGYFKSKQEVETLRCLLLLL